MSNDKHISHVGAKLSIRSGSIPRLVMQDAGSDVVGRLVDHVRVGQMQRIENSTAGMGHC